MKVKCEYCGSMINDQLEKCPNCGAPNKNVRRTNNVTPRTIAELKQWYEDRHLPPYETTRFYIGENYKGKRAFGIYQDGDEFVVYKNKDDGSRAIRYQGTDEAYAVNEIYLKLKSEILNQKSRQTGKRRARSGGKGPGSVVRKAGDTVAGAILIYIMLMFAQVLVMVPFVLVSGVIGAAPIPAILTIVLPLVAYYILKKTSKSFRKINKLVLLAIYVVILIISMSLIALSTIKSTTPVYYRYDDNVYVYYDHDYYLYDNDSYDYTPIYEENLPTELAKNPADYEFDSSGIEWNSDYSFKDSDYYESNLERYDRSTGYDSDYDYDYDSGFDWDSGSSWDSGGSDWSSDW